MTRKKDRIHGKVTNLWTERRHPGRRKADNNLTSDAKDRQARYHISGAIHIMGDVTVHIHEAAGDGDESEDPEPTGAKLDLRELQSAIEDALKAADSAAADSQAMCPKRHDCAHRRDFRRLIARVIRAPLRFLTFCLLVIFSLFPTPSRPIPVFAYQLTPNTTPGRI